MKVLQISRGLNPNYILRLYKGAVEKYIEYYKDTKPMIELHKLFDEKAFKVALSQIYLDGDYICVSSSNRLLRFLQYGGPGVKALYILSKAYNGLSGGLLW